MANRCARRFPLPGAPRSRTSGDGGASEDAQHGCGREPRSENLGPSFGPSKGTPAQSEAARSRLTAPSWSRRATTALSRCGTLCAVCGEFFRGCIFPCNPCRRAASMQTTVPHDRSTGGGSHVPPPVRTSYKITRLADSPMTRWFMTFAAAALSCRAAAPGCWSTAARLAWRRRESARR